MGRMADLNDLTLPALFERLGAGGMVRRSLEFARDEDLGGVGDLTSQACVPASAAGSAAIVARQRGVVAGLAVIPDLLEVFGAPLECRLLVADGDPVADGARLGVLRGSKRDILRVERTLLNFVGRLSGVATRTRTFVDAIGQGVKARVLDTRKTTPGLRVLEKYAVRCGGGLCHRIGLSDAVLIKDNHIAGVPTERLAQVITEASRRARGLAAAAEVELGFVEVEVDSLAQLERVLTVEKGLVDIVLLDNMDADALRQAVALRERAGSALQLEASGGVRLENVRLIAESGVDRISVGSLTHGATWLDIALDMLDE